MLSLKTEACSLSLYPKQINARIANCRTGSEWLGLYLIQREDFTMFTWCDLSSGIKTHRQPNKVLQESVGLSVNFLVLCTCVFLYNLLWDFYRIWGGMTIGSCPHARNSQVSFLRYRRSFPNSLPSRTKSMRLRKPRIRTSACGSSTWNSWLGISSWSSWLDLATGAMSRPRGRDCELGGDFSFQLQQMISSTEAPATNKSLLLY